MRAFAALLDRLVLTPQRTVKLRLMTDYFRATPDPDRGFALAALTGDLDIASVKPAMLRALATARVDEVLFATSYDYVGDLAETIALIWPAGMADGDPSPTFGPTLPLGREGSQPRMPRQLPACPPSSNACRRRRAARGRGWWKAGSTGSTPPAAGR